MNKLHVSEIDVADIGELTLRRQAELLVRETLNRAVTARIHCENSVRRRIGLDSDAMLKMGEQRQDGTPHVCDIAVCIINVDEHKEHGSKFSEDYRFLIKDMAY